MTQDFPPGYFPFIPTDETPVPDNSMVEQQAALALLELAFRKAATRSHFAGDVRRALDKAPVTKVTITWGREFSWYFRAPGRAIEDSHIYDVIWSVLKKAIVARARDEGNIASTLAWDPKPGVFATSEPNLWYAWYVEDIYRFMLTMDLHRIVSFSTVTERAFWPLPSDTQPEELA